MVSRSIRNSLVFVAVIATAGFSNAKPASGPADDIDRMLGSLQQSEWESTGSGLNLVLGGRIVLEACGSYPYHDNTNGTQGFQRLAADLLSGLQQGLQCMAGLGPMGSLHPYHEGNARRLIDLLNDDSGKRLRCVEDKTFAYAVAHPAKSPADTNEVLIDTYRVSGFLSRKFDRATYRDFFNLSQLQIEDHLTGKPLHVDGMHRYRDLPSLMFHEVIHWLGYEHTNLTADVVDLYDICCFGGSDHIVDRELNRGFQERACGILKDAQLWQADASTRERLWYQKGYFRLKREIRQAAD